MGVLNTQEREKRDRLFVSNFLSGVCECDDNTYAIDDDSHVVQTTIGRRSHHKTQAKASRAPRPQSYIKNTGRKARGCTNSRRFENAIFLSDLIEPGEFKDLVITDFVVQSQSTFNMLFEDDSEMDKWCEFMKMNDEEQEIYLQGLASVSTNKCSMNSHPAPRNRKNDSDFVKAEKCFQKVDRRIKTTLKNRNVSMTGLKFFEEEVFSFFTLINDGILVSLIPSSMDRLLVHGICQYMNLTSSSHPSHIILVENTKNQFCPPVIPLSQYLQHIT